MLHVNHLLQVQYLSKYVAREMWHCCDPAQHYYFISDVKVPSLRRQHSEYGGGVAFLPFLFKLEIA